MIDIAALYRSGLSSRAIAERCGMAHSTVLKRLRLLGVPKRSRLAWLERRHRPTLGAVVAEGVR